MKSKLNPEEIKQLLNPQDFAEMQEVDLEFAHFNAKLLQFLTRQPITLQTKELLQKEDLVLRLFKRCRSARQHDQARWRVAASISAKQRKGMKKFVKSLSTRYVKGLKKLVTESPVPKGPLQEAALAEFNERVLPRWEELRVTVDRSVRLINQFVREFNQNVSGNWQERLETDLADALDITLTHAWPQIKPKGRIQVIIACFYAAGIYTDLNLKSDPYNAIMMRLHRKMKKHREANEQDPEFFDTH